MTAIARTDAPRVPSPGPLASAWSRVWRARRLVERNILVYRHQWIIIVSGAFEPVFYLLGIGLGLGAIIETVPLADGRMVPYAAYVGPALVASAAMNGAVFETIFNVFFKLNYAKTYDGVLATPMGISEIAIGERVLLLLLGVAAVMAAGMDRRLDKVEAQLSAKQRVTACLQALKRGEQPGCQHGGQERREDVARRQYVGRQPRHQHGGGPRLHERDARDERRLKQRRRLPGAILEG